MSSRARGRSGHRRRVFARGGALPAAGRLKSSEHRTRVGKRHVASYVNQKQWPGAGQRRAWREPERARAPRPSPLSGFHSCPSPELYVVLRSEEFAKSGFAVNAQVRVNCCMHFEPYFV